jgi:multidrug resistance efflux pump
MRDDRDTLETVFTDLSEARAMLDAARHALERLREASDGDHAPLRQAEAQLERMADEVARIERVIEGQAVAAR